MSELDKNTPPLQQPKSKVVARKRIVGKGNANASYGGYGASQKRVTGKGNTGGSYGYGGSYGAGYGSYQSNYYGGYYGSGGSVDAGTNASVPNRTLRDYMMILRERIWYIFITFLVIVAGVSLHTARITPTYLSAAKIQILRDTDRTIPVVGAESSRNDVISNIEDFNTQVKILESSEIINLVRSRLKDEERVSLMAPYEDKFVIGPKLTEFEVITSCRMIMPERLSLIVNIGFEHPDARVAMQMANLFAQEYINYTQQARVKKLLEQSDELMHKVAQQDEKVKVLDKRLVEYREKYGAISLEITEDVDRKELSELNSILTSSKTQLERFRTLWAQLQESKEQGKSLLENQYITSEANVSKLISDRTQLQISMSTLEKRYKDKHPRMVEIRKALDQTNKELELAVEATYIKTKANLEVAETDYQKAVKHLNDKKAEMIELAKIAVAYNAIERERNVEKSVHSALITSMTVKTTQINLIGPAAQLVDAATMQIRYYKPNYILYIGAGLLAALSLGILVALLVAFLDDRAKSSYDIESVIGLPLLGVIPRIKKLNTSEKAQIVSASNSGIVTEAFRTLYSSIKASPVGKEANVILSTSTTPSEGKSFVITNLALTAAMNGEKVIVVDMDMRLPSIAKILNIKTDKGLISCIESGASVEEAIIKDFFPNMDILPSEKRATNPMNLLNSPSFVAILEKLRSEYDKVYIDSPPIGVVSDALNIFPAVDGVIYVVKFNAVDRKAIKLNVKRMYESNVPILGVVMNMTNMKFGAYYSTNYYNKQYQNYYHARNEELDIPSDIDDEDLNQQ